MNTEKIYLKELAHLHKKIVNLKAKHQQKITILEAEKQALKAEIDKLKISEKIWFEEALKRREAEKPENLKMR